MITPNEATLTAAFGSAVLGGVIGGAVSFCVSRYMVRHSANYSGQIDAINQTLAFLAATQAEMQQNLSATAADEKARHEAAARRAEAARWKPKVSIASKPDGAVLVNELILKSPDNFFLIEASLLGPNGARLEDYKVVPGVATNGFRVPITHASLNKLTNSLPPQSADMFRGSVQYTVLREKESDPYTGVLPFAGQRVIHQNTCTYSLTG